MIAALSLASLPASADTKTWVEPEVIKVPHLSWTNTLDVHATNGSSQRTRVDIEDLELRKYRGRQDWIATAGTWKVSGEGKTWTAADEKGCSVRQGYAFLGGGQMNNRAGATASGKLKLDRASGTYSLSFIVRYTLHYTQWEPCPPGSGPAPPDAETLVMPNISASATFEAPNIVHLNFETDEAMGASHTVTTGKGKGDASVCGPDITDALRATAKKIRDHWASIGADQRSNICTTFVNPEVSWFAWDMAGMHHEGEWTQCGGQCAVPAVNGGGCYSTVVVENRCFYTGSVNYLMEGIYAQLCEAENDLLMNGNTYQDLIYFWKVWLEELKGHPPAANFDTASQWAAAGYKGWPDGAPTPMTEPRYLQCDRSCNKTFDEFYPYATSVPGTLQVRVLFSGPN